MGHHADDDASSHKEHPTLYLIRHGEKPPKLPSGDDADGLSTAGVDRAQKLRQVFGKDSPYNIGYILAERPKDDHIGRMRPLLTVQPLANDLGLTVDTSVKRDDVEKAAKAAKAWKGPGNVLVCWEHGELAKIATAIGVQGEVKYPGDRFDLIWVVRHPYTEIGEVGSEDGRTDM